MYFYLLKRLPLEKVTVFGFMFYIFGIKENPEEYTLHLEGEEQKMNTNCEPLTKL